MSTLRVFQEDLDDIMKRLDEAITHGKKAVKLDPKSASAHSNLGIAYYDQKDTKHEKRSMSDSFSS